MSKVTRPGLSSILSLLIVCFLFSLICCQAQANTYYWGLPSIYSSVTGYNMAGVYANMMARANGAYAFSDYVASWGLNNFIQSGEALAIGGSGMNQGVTNLLSTMINSYQSASPMFGYSPYSWGNSWSSNYSLNLPGYSFQTSLSPLPNYTTDYTTFSFPSYHYLYNFPPYYNYLNYWNSSSTTGDNGVAGE